MRRAIQLFSLCILWSFLGLVVSAQTEEPPEPQFLYRSGNTLILLNGYTGEIVELPFDVASRDRFMWSPDGRYILSQRYDSDGANYCLNLYDVDQQTWISDDPIACNTEDALFSSDGSQLIYVQDVTPRVTLQVFNIADENYEELYRAEGDEIYYPGLSNLRWSPTERYLTFIRYDPITSGAFNHLEIMDIQTLERITIEAPNTYYATYFPIWSDDDSWFLIRMRDNYGGFNRLSNDRGDVYLVNVQSSEQYRLTYTPTVLEQDIHWTDDGNIAFTEVIEQEVTFSIDQAQTVEPVPYDEIVQPPDAGMPGFESNFDMIVSPDPNLRAWESITNSEEGTVEWIIAPSIKSPPVFSIQLPEDDYHIIGWRPSDYPYSQE